MTALLQMEEATLRRQNLTGALLSEDRVGNLKTVVHEFVVIMWKEASVAFQEHLSNLIHKFKSYFEVSGRLKMVKDNRALQMQVQEVQVELEAERSKVPQPVFLYYGEETKPKDSVKSEVGPQFVPVLVSRPQNLVWKIVVEVLEDMKN